MNGKIDRSGGPDACWLWLGGHLQSGYAMGSRTTAHREVYEKMRGPIPPGLEIDHLCRNRGCVNPSHLEAVTHQENIRRSPVNSGRCRIMGRQRSPLNAVDVADIRRLRERGVSPGEIANRYNLHKKSIWRIVSGKRWGADLDFRESAGIVAQEQRL